MITLPITHLVQIRHIRREDLPALEWGGEYSHFRRVFADTFRRVEVGEALMWVAELPRVGIIGQLFVQMTSQNTELADSRSRAYIFGFRVRSDYRGIGVGSRLLKNAETDLSRRGFRRVSLNVGQENREARRLYERFGYRVLAAEPGIWCYLDEHGQRHQVDEPAWRMEKKF